MDPSGRYQSVLLVIAVAIALAGTSVELYAVYRKIVLQYGEKIHRLDFWSTYYQKLADGEQKCDNQTVYMIKSLNLNRTLAPWRFGLDDLPATVLATYILVTFPNQADAATVRLRRAHASDARLVSYGFDARCTH